MIIPPVLRVLRERRELAEAAAFPFNFDLERTEHVEEVRLASGRPLHPVAGDDTGGTYFLCAGGEVLYADSEGSAGLIGADLAEALETVIGLPGWEDYVDLDPEADDATLADVISECEAELAEWWEVDLDAARTALLEGLGLRRVPGPELVRRLQRALLRTEPDHLLLNAEEGLAYRLLDRLPRPPLWEVALAPGRADLAAARRDPAGWEEIAADEGRRAGVLRAAQCDRRAGDLPLLRVLLRHEWPLRVTDEFRLAAVLVGLHGRPEDHAFLRELCDTDFDVSCHLGGFPDEPAGLRAWAAGLDEGDDPAEESEFTWVELALRQGRTEPARCVLLRMLDDCGPRDALRLRSLAHYLARLGDHWQAARAQFLHSSLLDDPRERGGAVFTLASLQRRAGETERAWRSLREAVVRLDGDGGWRGLSLGLSVTEEHFLVCRAALAEGLAATARAAFAAGTALLEELPRPTERLRQMARELGTALRPAR